MITLPVIAECYPANVGYVQTENGTKWQGIWFRFLAENQGFFPTYELITESEFIPGNQTYTTLQTLFEGRADIIPDTFGITPKRFQYVDFSHLVDTSEGQVITAKQPATERISFFSGVFDVFSMLGFILTTCSLWLTILVVHKGISSENIVQTLTYGTGSLLGQPIPIEAIHIFTSLYILCFLNNYC